MTSPMTTEPAPTQHSGASRFFRSADGRLTVWQPPNPALCVWLVALVLGWLPLSDSHAAAVDGVRHGALVVWALDEVVRGESPFRRVLGAVVLVAQLVALVLG